MMVPIAWRFALWIASSRLSEINDLPRPSGWAAFFLSQIKEGAALVGRGG